MLPNQIETVPLEQTPLPLSVKTVAMETRPQPLPEPTVPARDSTPELDALLESTPSVPPRRAVVHAFGGGLILVFVLVAAALTAWQLLGGGR